MMKEIELEQSENFRELSDYFSPIDNNNFDSRYFFDNEKYIDAFMQNMQCTAMVLGFLNVSIFFHAET